MEQEGLYMQSSFKKLYIQLIRCFIGKQAEGTQLSKKMKTPSECMLPPQLDGLGLPINPFAHAGEM